MGCGSSTSNGVASLSHEGRLSPATDSGRGVVTKDEQQLLQEQQQHDEQFDSQAPLSGLQSLPASRTHVSAHTSTMGSSAALQSGKGLVRMRSAASSAVSGGGVFASPSFSNKTAPK